MLRITQNGHFTICTSSIYWQENDQQFFCTNPILTWKPHGGEKTFIHIKTLIL